MEGGQERQAAKLGGDFGPSLYTPHQQAGEHLKHLAPLSLSAIEEKAFFMDNEKIFCVDLKTGQDIWQAPFGTTGLFIRNYAPTLVASNQYPLPLAVSIAGKSCSVLPLATS